MKIISKLFPSLLKYLGVMFVSLVFMVLFLDYNFSFSFMMSLAISSFYVMLFVSEKLGFIIFSSYLLLLPLFHFGFEYYNKNFNGISDLYNSLSNRVADIHIPSFRISMESAELLYFQETPLRNGNYLNVESLAIPNTFYVKENNQWYLTLKFDEIFFPINTEVIQANYPNTKNTLNILQQYIPLEKLFVELGEIKVVTTAEGDYQVLGYFQRKDKHELFQGDFFSDYESYNRLTQALENDASWDDFEQQFINFQKEVLQTLMNHTTDYLKMLENITQQPGIRYRQISSLYNSDFLFIGDKAPLSRGVSNSFVDNKDTIKMIGALLNLLSNYPKEEGMKGYVKGDSADTHWYVSDHYR